MSDLINRRKKSKDEDKSQAKEVNEPNLFMHNHVSKAANLIQYE